MLGPFSIAERVIVLIEVPVAVKVPKWGVLDQSVECVEWPLGLLSLTTFEQMHNKIYYCNNFEIQECTF